MELQIIGRKGSKETRKAERWCTDRSIRYQFVDLDQRPLSVGELGKILQHVEAEQLIDTESKAYRKGGFAYLEYDPVEEILEDPQLLKSPILRSDHGVAVGFDEKVAARIIEGKQ